MRCTKKYFCFIYLIMTQMKRCNLQNNFLVNYLTNLLITIMRLIIFLLLKFYLKSNLSFKNFHKYKKIFIFQFHISNNLSDDQLAPKSTGLFERAMVSRCSSEAQPQIETKSQIPIVSSSCHYEAGFV